MKGDRAQAGIEFMICVTFLVLIVIIFTIYSGGKQSEDTAIKSKVESEGICWEISNLINTAMYSTGFYSTFTLPMQIEGQSYNLSITNTTVSTDYMGHSCLYGVTVTNISFRNTPAPFSLCGGNFYINNTNGGVVIGNLSVVGC